MCVVALVVVLWCRGWCICIVWSIDSCVYVLCACAGVSECCGMYVCMYVCMYVDVYFGVYVRIGYSMNRRVQVEEAGGVGR